MLYFQYIKHPSDERSDDWEGQSANIVPLSEASSCKSQTTADFPCSRRRCCSARCCFCWTAPLRGLRSPNLWQDISSPPGALVVPGKHTGRSSWGGSASSWDTPPGPSPALELQRWQTGSLSKAHGHFEQHLVVLDWRFEKLWRRWCCGC